MALDPGGTLLHYRLLEKIGEGGMGVVYKALDTRLSRHVALKLLKPDLTRDPQRRARLLSEARAAAALNHPSVATIHAIDQDGGVTFIVMELIEGPPLRALIDRGALLLPDVLRIARQVAGGLAHAHAAGIVHRDLKPENVLIRPDLRAKILDFGLAAIRGDAELRPLPPEEAEEAITRDLAPGERLAGTARYMSPEQARGEEVDARADVFSLGVVLYEMLGGRPPFAGPTLMSTLARVLEAEPEPLAALRPDIPPGLADLVHRCLSKDPGGRPGDAAPVLRELKALAAASGATGRTPERIEGSAAPEGGPSGAVSLGTIAVFPFAFRGAPEFSYLGAGMVDLVSTKLDGAGELRSVDPHVMICCGAEEASDPNRASALARRYGAGLFVLGRILEVGGRLSLDASLYEGGGTVREVARASARGEASRIFDMVDQLTAALLVSRWAGPASRLARIGAMATTSFDALKAYLEGESEMRALRRAAAADAYRRAVAADPDFALAWYRLAVAALWSGQSEEAVRAAREAVGHASRLTERDRELLEAFAAALKGDNDEAEARYRAIVGAHPDDVEAWYQLGELMFHSGPPRGRPIADSRAAWERLLFLDPRHVNGLVHLAAIESTAGDGPRLESAVRQIERLGSGSDAAVWVRAYRAFHRGDESERGGVMDLLRRASDYTVTFTVHFLGSYLGDLAGSLELARLLTEPVRSPEVRAFGHVTRAHLEMARGRPRAARQEIEAAAPLDAPAAAAYGALLLLHPAAGAETAELAGARERLGRIEEWPPPRGVRAGAWLAPHAGLGGIIRTYVEGMLHVREGHADEAKRCAARLLREPAPDEAAGLAADLAAGVRAQAARAEGRPAEALALLESARMRSRFDLIIWSPFHSRALERFLRADLLAQAGRHAEALCWYRCFAENSIFDQVYTAPSLRRAGEIAERMGDTAAAARHYGRFVDLWEDCDPVLRPEVAAARSRRARSEGPMSP